jgi:hypothetical protein
VQSARDGLQKIIADAIRRSPAAEAPLHGWPLACGATVAARTRALVYSDGVLRVEVPDAQWRSELLALAPRYLATLNQFAKVKRIEFVTAQESGGRPPYRTSNIQP